MSTRSSLTTKLAKRAFSLAEGLANKRGYRIRWDPPLLQNPDAELPLDLEFIVAHLMLRKKDIFFIQIGANDGVSADPVYKFANAFGWKGILVEPQPDIFERLKKNYEKCAPNLKFLNAAVSTHDGMTTMYAVRPDDNTFDRAHFYTTFDRDYISQQTRWVPDIAKRIIEIPVRCITMNTLLRQAEGREIDYLQMDTEGYDFEILKMLDFNIVRPAIICFEHVLLTKREMADASELLFRHGYRVHRDNLDTVAYRQTFTYGWRYQVK